MITSFIIIIIITISFIIIIINIMRGEFGPCDMIWLV